jgi:hypothetical protein
MFLPLLASVCFNIARPRRDPRPQLVRMHVTGCVMVVLGVAGATVGALIYVSFLGHGYSTRDRGAAIPWFLSLPASVLLYHYFLSRIRRTL